MSVKQLVRAYLQPRPGIHHYSKVAEGLRRTRPEYPHVFKFAEAYIGQILRELRTEGFVRSGPSPGEFLR